MERRPTGTIIEFPAVGPMGWAMRACAGEDRIETVRRLGGTIADAADADQWSVSIPGVDVIGPADLGDLVPRRLLQVLNGGRPATHRLNLPLCVPGRDLGVIRLATIRPGGFRSANIARACEAADRAALLLAAVEAVRDQTDRTPESRSRVRHRRGRRANLRLCQPWPTDWSFPPDVC
jgi:hypothetical protein